MKVRLVLPGARDKFLQLTSDSTKKFIAYTPSANADDAYGGQVKAVGITRALTVIAEGYMSDEDLDIVSAPPKDGDGDRPELLDIFDRHGFIVVDKIEDY